MKCAFSQTPSSAGGAFSNVTLAFETDMRFPFLTSLGRRVLRRDTD